MLPRPVTGLCGPHGPIRRTCGPCSVERSEGNAGRDEGPKDKWCCHDPDTCARLSWRHTPSCHEPPGARGHHRALPPQLPALALLWRHGQDRPAHRSLPAVRLADPDGREQVISCGAAHFNIRLAMRHLGFRPVVRPFPSACDPAHLARVNWGAYERASHAEELMNRALRKRHTHRGPFRTSPVPQELLDGLREAARSEGADLYTVAPGRQYARVAELIRWSQEFNGARLDGVPLSACSYHPDCVTLAGRDFVGLTSALPLPPEIWPTRTGRVAVLTTQRDTRTDWLCAGQAGGTDGVAVRPVPTGDRSHRLRPADCVHSSTSGHRSAASGLLTWWRGEAPLRALRPLPCAVGRGALGIRTARAAPGSSATRPSRPSRAER